MPKPPLLTSDIDVTADGEIVGIYDFHFWGPNDTDWDRSDGPAVVTFYALESINRMTWYANTKFVRHNDPTIPLHDFERKDRLEYERGNGMEMTLTDANDRAAAYGYLLVNNMALGNRNHHPIAIVDVKSSVLVACEKSPRLALDWIAEQLDYLGEEHDLD